VALLSLGLNKNGKPTAESKHPVSLSGQKLRDLVSGMFRESRPATDAKVLAEIPYG